MKNIFTKIKNWWRQDHEAIARKRILNQMIEKQKMSVMPPFIPQKQISFKEGDKVLILESCSGTKEGQVCELKANIKGKLFAFVNGLGRCCECQHKWYLLTDDNKPLIFKKDTK